MLRTEQRSWELPDHRPNLTASRAAYKPYSTWVASDGGRPPKLLDYAYTPAFYRVKPKTHAWLPEAKAR